MGEGITILLIPLLPYGEKWNILKQQSEKERQKRSFYIMLDYEELLAALQPMEKAMKDSAAAAMPSSRLL